MATSSISISKSSKLSIINAQAWALLKSNTFSSWGDAFRAAKIMLQNGSIAKMNDESVITELQKGDCILVFRKKDGSITERIATRKSEIVEQYIGHSSRTCYSLFFLEKSGENYMAKSAAYGSVISCKLIN